MNTVLFDLDGTLLPMEQEEFLGAYLPALGKKCAFLGYEPKTLIKAVWAGTDAMVKNDGTLTNEERFWAVFGELLGKEALEHTDVFEEFYSNEFREIGKLFPPNPYATKCVKLVKEKGYTIAAATNPLFPKIATLARMEWAGVDAQDFDLITSYENSRYCKPNLSYYTDILEKLGKAPSDCLMIGNDVKEDMCTAELGMDTYLLTDHLTNEEKLDISGFKQGDFGELYEYLQTLPDIR